MFPQNSNYKLNKAIYHTLLGVWMIACLFIGVQASMQYPGSVFLYWLFTISAASMFWLSVRHFVGYGQIFLGVFLWLGIWLKLSMHLISGADYVEATGDFIFEPSAYDELLLVATVAHIFICIVWLLVKISIRSDGATIQQSPGQRKSNEIAPRFMMSAIFLYALFIVAINTINWNLGILRVGLVPQTILIWPGNAVVSWLLGSGFPLISGVLLLAAMPNRLHFILILFLVLLEGILSSITTLSRGAFIWHVLPVLTVIWINRHYFSQLFSRRILVGIVIFVAISATAGIVAANFTRNAQYALQQSNEAVEFESTDALSQVSGLVFDRWLGVEGLMVAVGHSQKNPELFLDLMMEKNEIGKLPMYQTIANSIYVDSDLEIFQVGTIPGLVGFLYLSNSFFVVIAGVVFLCLYVVLIERLVLVLTQNVFIAAYMGLWLANSVAQFGLIPRQWFFSCFIIFLTITIIAIVQTLWLRVGFFGKSGD